MKSTREFIDTVIKNYLGNGNNQYAASIKRNYPSLYQQIITDYPAQKPAQSLYNFVHDISVEPTCNECDSKVRFVNYSTGYQHYCGATCKNSSSTVKEKRKKTNKQKYGTTSVLQSTYGKAKTKQTLQQNYGVDNYSKTPQFKQKFKSTMQQRYGCDYAMQSEQLKARYVNSLEGNHGVKHPSQSPEIYNNRNQAMKHIYGVEHAMQSTELKQKQQRTLQINYQVDVPLKSKQVQATFKQTMKERYGKHYTAQVDWLFEQMKQTNMGRYGVEYPLQNDGIKERKKQTNMEKYGVESPSQSEDVRKQTRINMEEQGRWIPQDLLSEAVLYYKQVMRYTNKQSLHLLENFDKRGRAGTDNAFHIDHKVSIKHGFENGIPPYIIGSIHNLEMLPWEDNVSKSNKCSIDPTLLIDTVISSCAIY